MEKQRIDMLFCLNWGNTDYIKSLSSEKCLEGESDEKKNYIRNRYQWVYFCNELVETFNATETV